MKSRHKGRHFFRYMSISEAKLPTQSTPFRIFYQYFNKFSYFSTEIQTQFLNRGTVPCQNNCRLVCAFSVEPRNDGFATYFAKYSVFSQ